MKYILMVNGKRLDFERYAHWSKDDFQANAAFMKAFREELTESAVFVSSEDLEWPNEAKLICTSEKGEPITSGVFSEFKEFLAGYWIVDVESSEEAFAIAARLSQAPERDGKANGMPVEVRRVLSGHSDFGL